MVDRACSIPIRACQTLPCPQNLLTSFGGPGGFTGQGALTHPNSTFISIAGVPEDLTSISVPGEGQDHWNKTSTPKVYFSTQAPNLSKGATVLNSANKPVALPVASKYIPAPIKSISYGVTPVGSVCPCPSMSRFRLTARFCPRRLAPAPLPKTPTEPNFAPAPVTLASLQTDNTCCTTMQRIAPERRSCCLRRITRGAGQRTSTPVN